MVERGTSESWVEYRRLVLAALERLDQEVSDVRKELNAGGGKLGQLEKLTGAIHNVVFGDTQHESVETRLAMLEKFMNEHPSLLKEPVSGDTSRKVDTKMLVLLVGAIGGLISILGKAFDLISKLVGG